MRQLLSREAIRVAALALLLSGAPAMAAETAPAPSCDGALFRAFDFWIGEWEVFDRAGAKAGDSTISLEERGCLLVERWRSVGVGRGQSFNFVDRTTGKWRQVFVSSWGVKDYQGGPDAEGRMHLEGRVGYAEGVTAPFRGTWSPNADGTVTQVLEEFDSGAERWTEWFAGIYRRAPVPVAAAPPPTAVMPFVRGSSLERCDGHEHGSGKFWRWLGGDR